MNYHEGRLIWIMGRFKQRMPQSYQFMHVNHNCKIKNQAKFWSISKHERKHTKKNIKWYIN